MKKDFSRENHLLYPVSEDVLELWTISKNAIKQQWKKYCR